MMIEVPSPPEYASTTFFTLLIGQTLLLTRRKRRNEEDAEILKDRLTQTVHVRLRVLSVVLRVLLVESVSHAAAPPEPPSTTAAGGGGGAGAAPHPVARTSSSARSNRRISLRLTTSGGRSRTTLSPARVTRMPFSRRAFTTGSAAASSSMPTIRPRLLTCFTAGYVRAMRFRPRRRSVAFAFTLGRNSGAVRRSSTTRDAAAATGLPPKVLPWSPTAIAPASSSLRSTAPSGRPPPSGLARVTMSGRIPAC